MAKEEKLFSVRSKLNDRDFDEVFRIYLETERGKDRKTAPMFCAAVCLGFIVLWVFIRSLTFLFYAVGAVIVGMLYMFVPVNKKFIAANRLHLGEERETSFYPHAVTSLELFEDEDTADMDEDEIEAAATRISTLRLAVYENMRGFLFSDGKIINQFLYVPKRGLTKQEIAEIQDFAQKRCSRGYQLLEMRSMVGQEDEDDDAAQADTSVTEAVCDRYYGVKKLHIYDENGERVSFDEEQPEEEAAEEETAEPDPDDFDVDAEWEKIIAEDADNE